MKNIGIYGGTFDPPHLGHLNLAVEMMELRRLDEVWFCPAQLSPLKLDSPPSCHPLHRYQMVQKAIKGIPNFKVLDIEVLQEGPSYTIETLKKLKKDYPNLNFWLILGEDTIEEFSKWKDPHEIIQLAPPLVGGRSLPPNWDLVKDPLIQKAMQEGWTPTRLMEISSTDIRHRLQEKLICNHLLPKEVMDFIEENRLYLPLKNQQDDQDVLNRSAQAIFDKKGFNILCLDVRNCSTLTDYLLITEGSSDRHVKALCSSVVEALKVIGLVPYSVQGEKEGGWIVLDYGNFMIHFFQTEIREKYTLEEHWNKGSVVDLTIKIDKGQKNE